jgi:hypothetical protein
MKKGNVRQELFTLTPDMVPIELTSFEPDGVSLICPLPKDFRKVIIKRNGLLMHEVKLMVKDINGKVCLRKQPFENILLGYPQKTMPEQENKRLKSSMTKDGEVDPLKFFLTKDEESDLLKTFQILELKTDSQDGISTIIVGGGDDKGGVRLADISGDYFEKNANIGPIAFLFEPEVAFAPHTVFPNLKNYGQALLAREFCVRYFNILNLLLFWK